MKLQYGAPREQTCVADFVDEVPTGEFAAITRSTVPLLSWWSDANALTLTRGLGLGRPTQATFEYPVRAGCSTCKGRGKSSFTDVMLEGDDYALAIEAKHTEPLYENVSHWLGTPASENKSNVLRHWLHCVLKRDLEASEVGGLVYQMVHRTASACVAAGTRSAHVIHLLFGSSAVEKYLVATRETARLLSPEGRIKLSVVSVPMEHGDDYAQAVADLETGDPETLRDRIRDGASLFKFGAPVIHRT